MKLRYEVDSVLVGPDELGSDNGVPADWLVWFVGRPEGARAGAGHHMVVRFASRGVNRAQAEEIVARILRGLNEEVKSD